MYKVTHFEKTLFIGKKKPYGLIKVYFGSRKRFKNFGRISLEKFMALSHILENDDVAYDSINKIFITPVEKSKFVKAPKNRIL